LLLEDEGGKWGMVFGGSLGKVFGSWRKVRYEKGRWGMKR
jgi:hypothetical protein